MAIGMFFVLRSVLPMMLSSLRADRIYVFSSPDLRAEAVARSSAIIRSQRKKKDLPEKKLRGTKARKAAEGKTKS